MLVMPLRSYLKEVGATPTQVEEFSKDATSGDYDHVLQTCIKWVEVE
jgi:hypothetical protein